MNKILLSRCTRRAALLIWAAILMFQELPARADHIPLSDEQTQWISAHPVLRVGVGVAFPPFMWVEENNGQKVFKGIVSDYLAYLTEHLGLEMNIVFDIPFNEALAQGRKKQIDLFPCLSQTPERAEFLRFTPPYLNYPLVVITREDAPIIGRVEDLRGKRIALVRHLFIYSRLKNQYPDLDVTHVFTKTVDENLEAVSLARADACIINLAAASYYIQKKGLTNLRIAAPVDWEGVALAMGARSDWPVLAGILEKALNAMPQAEKDRITQRWIRVAYDPGIDIAQFWPWILALLAGTGMICLFFLAWNHRLKQEIREKEKAEQALRQSRRKLSTLLGNLPGMAYSCVNDQDWTMLYMSDGCLELTGYTPSELVQSRSLSYGELIHPEDRSYVWKAVQKAIREKQPFTIEYRIRDKAGREKWVWEKGIALERNRRGRIVLEGVVHDVSDRRAAEYALRESEQNLLEVQFMTRVGSWIWDLAQKRVTCSGEMLRMFGFDRSEPAVALDRFWNRIHEQDRDRVTAEMDQALSVSNRFESRFRTVPVSGEIRHVHGMGKVVRDDQGKPVTVKGSCQDITERARAEAESRRLEHQLRHAHKMEAIGTLAGGIAHEFNNLLGIIMGNAELAMDPSLENHPAGKCLREIRKASLRGKEVVKQLLNFSRVNRPERQAVDLDALVKESVGFLRASLPAQISFGITMDESPYPMMADPAQVQQVVINLCTNAAQAMESEGGTIGICLEKVRVKTRKSMQDQVLNPGNYLKLAVSDTGHGIPEGMLDKVFTPFYTTRDVDKGTGMGLAVVYGILKGHGGVIDIETVQGQGTTVSCYFPPGERLPDPTVRHHKLMPRAEPLARGSERLLFVDDEPALAETVKEQLAELGYHVRAFTDPTEALAAFKGAPADYDLVITDMAMPRLPGDRLIQSLRQIDPGIKTIICTGYSKRMVTAGDMGADHWLMKPVDMKTLAASVREVLDRPNP